MKIFKRILKILSIVFIVFVISLIALFYHYKNSWTKFWSRDQIKALAAEINATKEAPPIFYYLYDSILPDVRHSDMSDKIFDSWNRRLNPFRKTEFKNRGCSCIMLYSLQDVKPNHGRDLYGFALTEYTTPEKCFDYIIFKSPFNIDGKEFIGVDEISKHYFGKNVHELNHNQTWQLIDILIGGPHRRPGNVIQK